MDKQTATYAAVYSIYDSPVQFARYTQVHLLVYKTITKLKRCPNQSIDISDSVRFRCYVATNT